MSVDPLIEEHWPQLAALHAWLDDADGKKIKVKHHDGGHDGDLNEDELLKRLLAKLNRPGGPKISSRAIV